VDSDYLFAKSAFRLTFTSKRIVDTAAEHNQDENYNQERAHIFAAISLSLASPSQALVSVLATSNQTQGGFQAPRPPNTNSASDFRVHSGLTCRSTSGLTEISPLNGRSWLAISSTDMATPVAKIHIAIAAPARLSL